MKNKGPQKLGDLFNSQPIVPPPPAYKWQDLALRVIKELGIPNFKRGSVFKICKDYPQERVEKAMNDTKELCKEGECWKYFFKVIGNPGPDNKKNNQ